MPFQQAIRSKSRSSGRASSGPLGPETMTGGREIPDKLYFRIGEVAKLCEVVPHVLRFWESEFPQLKPNKGGTGQRLYRRRDVEMALRVKALLYDEGYTIAGARQFLKGELRSKEPIAIAAVEESSMAPAVRNISDMHKLKRLRNEMQELLAMLSGPPSARPSAATVQPIRPAKTKLSAARIEPLGLFDDLY